jgi:hypothetical protein
MDYIGEIQAVISNLHGCDSKYLETVPIIEEFNGQTVWEGEVEVFELIGHPKAERCYAWGHATGENDQARRYVTVLELPPVDSPQTAVRAGVVSEIKNARAKKKSRTP